MVFFTCCRRGIACSESAFMMSFVFEIVPEKTYRLTLTYLTVRTLEFSCGKPKKIQSELRLAFLRGSKKLDLKTNRPASRVAELKQYGKVYIRRQAGFDVGIGS